MSLGSFHGVDTTTANKLAVIREQIGIITRAFPQKFNGYCLGLPGTGAQCDRHIVEYSRYGIDSRRKIFVDYDYAIHQSHVQWKKTTNLRVRLIYSDICKALKSMWDEGKQIDIIDYDGTSFFNHSHEQVLQDAKDHDAKVVIIVMTTRAPHLTSYHKDWKQRLGLEKRWVHKYREYREPMSDIATGALEAIAEECGFDCYFSPYAGRRVGPPMVSCVFINRKFIDF